MMRVAAVIPVFVEVGLIFVLMFWMGYLRLGALKRREARVADTALNEPNWPARPTQVANALRNQFEFPVLYFALVPLAIIFQKADLLFVVLSWLFVLARVAHAYVHVTSNHVPTRFRVFLLGAIVLLVMWIIFALQVLTGL
jgi:hypothetical protein